MARPQAVSAADVTTRRMRFVEVANKRVATALRAIRGVGQLSRSRFINEAFSEADLVAIIDALNAEVQQQLPVLKAAVTGHQLDIEFDLAKPNGADHATG